MKSSNHLCRLSLEGKQKRFFVAKKKLQMLHAGAVSKKQIIIFQMSYHLHHLGNLAQSAAFLIISSSFPSSNKCFCRTSHPKSHIAGRPYHFLLERCPKTYSWPAGRGWQLFGESLESRRHGPNLRVGRGIVHIRSLVGEV